MARISFIPLPETGHINPTLRLAKQLAQSGHQVSYLGLPDFEEQVRSQGLGFVPVLASLVPRGSLKRLAEQRVNLYDVLSRDKEPLQRELAAAIEALRPDLFLVDIVLQDLTLVARAAGVPCAVLSTSLDQPRLPLIDGVGRNPVEDHPLLVLCPRVFDLPEVPAREGRHDLEASIDLERREPDGFPWERLEDARPLVYCSLGSHPQDYEKSEELFQAVLEAAGQRPEWQVVLAAGPAYIGSSIFRDVPSNVVAVEWVPQLAMLKKARVMITHGGLGTTKECIYFGVPMVVFPMAFDQPGNALRIARHGLGLPGNTRNLAAAHVLHLVDRVLADARFLTRVAAMSEVFREHETSGTGVRVIEELLGLGAKVAPEA